MILPSPFFFLFFFNDTATTEIYTLSLHDALPIYSVEHLFKARNLVLQVLRAGRRHLVNPNATVRGRYAPLGFHQLDRKSTRLNSSHQIISYAVFCLKKKNTRKDPSS